MRLPRSQRIQARPEDQLFAPARFDRPLEAGPASAAQDLEALRIENISPRQQLPGSAAKAGVATDLAENYGSTLDRIVEELGPVARLMRGENLPDATAAQIAAARSGEFYNMRPVYDALRADGVPHDEAIRRIRQESQAFAGTSPRTKTDQNLLNSAFLQNRMARGLPVDQASVRAATGPGSGYAMIYDQHPALTQGLLEGTISLAQNPKPSIFARNISGDRSAVTADVHNVRAVNMLYNDVNPGGLPASSFDTANDYRRYREAYTPDANGNVRGMNDAELREILVARPSGQDIRGQDVSTEYPIYNDITTRVAERLGLTPADTQALMWFHYGPRTGLASEAHTVPELLNQRMSITAQGLGMSPEEVMRLYSRNMIPLAGAAPAAVLLSDGEPRASLEELGQKYAEGGRVRRVAGAVARGVRGRREPEQPSTYPTATETPRFKVEPQPGQPFDDWIDSIYAPENRGPDNVSRFPSLMYRGVSDAELDAAIQGGSIRPLSGSGVYIENSPDRYVGGGAYGAKRAGAILQFDVGGLPSINIASSHARDLMESGVPEIPLERITRIWRWDPDRKAHVLMPDEEAALLLRRNREQASGSLEELSQKYAEGGEVRTPEEEEYDNRLLSRMKAHTGRVTEPTRAEQMQALRTAGREAAEGLADVLLPQSPLDFALMAAMGPGGRAARLAGSAALASLEPSEAEAGALRRLGTRFVRRSQSFDSPFNKDAEHIAMFAETKNPRETLDRLKIYGPAAWISRGDDAVDVRDIQPEIVRALRNSGLYEDYNTTAAALARSANPQNIVDSAGLWDDPTLVREIYENVLQPREITSVRTKDGLLVFDPVNVRPIRTEYAEGGLAQLDQKYAEGGVVRSEAATYDPDAVDALVKQIEAQYV